MNGESTFSERRLRELERRIEELLRHKKAPQGDPRQVILDNAGLLALLHISPNTAANWRAQRRLTYSRVNHKFYYRLSDVLAMLEEHTVKRLPREGFKEEPGATGQGP